MVLPAVAAVGAVGLALLPLITPRSTRPTSAGSTTARSSTRFWETGVSFLVGETGHVIAEPPRERYALIPVVLIGVALAAGRCSAAPAASGAAPRSALAVGLGVVLLAAVAALAGKDYVVERNLLPALVPLRRRRRDRLRRRAAPAASGCCWRSCSAPTGSPSTSTSPRRRTCSAPTSAAVADAARPAARAARDRHLEARRRPGRASTCTTAPSASTAATTPVREIDVISKPLAAGRPGQRCRASFHPVAAGEARSPHPDPLRVQAAPSEIPFHPCATCRTGFGATPRLRRSVPAARERGRAGTDAMSASEFADRLGAAARRPASWWQLLKFGIVGGSGYLINLAVFALLGRQPRRPPH